MKIASFFSAFTILTGIGLSSLHADIVTSDFVNIADGRVQSSGINGQELFTAEENVVTRRSGPSNVSDGLFEFDLSSLPADAVLIEAEILFRTAAQITNTNSTAPVEFYGFTGNGILELADESAVATLVSSMDFTTSVANNTEISTDVSDLSIIESVLSDANVDDFFTLRSETVNFVTFRVDSLESTDPDAAPATLRLTFETASVPEPSSLTLMGLISIGFLARRRRMV